MASAPISSDELIELVRKSGLADDRLDNWLRQNPTLPAQLQATAAKLVQDGLLTSFHATHMLSGKFKGFILGQYKVLDQIGAGGMGVIYLAEHLTMKRRVALKVLPSDKASDEESLQRFHREARVVAALDHPNVVRAFDVDKCGDLHFMAMEYIEGESLEQILRRRGPFPFAEAADYIAQAARGLQHAHERGLVHRDIKPGNLVLDKSGVIKILDMGLARFFEENSNLTTELCSGSVIGTADYMAPEQAVNSHDVDIRADIYSLGITLYALLAGQPPFANLTVTQKLLAHHMRAPEPLQQVRPGTPDELAAIAVKMMAKHPADRYQTPQEVASALASYLSTPFDLTPQPLSLDEAPVDYAPAKKLPPPRRKRGWLVPASVAAVVLISGIVIAIAASVGRKPPDTPAKNDSRARSNIPNPIDPVPPKSTDQPAREVGRFAGQAEAVEGVALSPNGTRLLTCAGNSLKLWDIETASVVRDLNGHQDAVRFVAFDATGDRAVSCSFDGTIRVWDLRDGHEVLQIAHPGAKFLAAVLSADGKHIFSGTLDGVAQYWDVESKKAVQTLNQQAGAISGIALSADDRTGYTGGSDGICRYWNLTNGDEETRFDMKGHAIRSLALSSDGRSLAVGATTLTVLDPAMAYELRSFAAADLPAISAFTFSRDRRFLATARQDRKIQLWSLTTGKLIDTFGEHPDDITGLVFLNDNTQLISTSRDKTIRKWAIADAWARAPRQKIKPGFIKTYETHDQQIARLALSPNDNVIAGGSLSGKIQFWDLETAKMLREFDAHKGNVNCIEFSSSGRLLASSGQDGTIKIWNTITGKEVRTITSAKGPAWSIAWSPDARFVFAGSDDGIGRIWDVKTGNLVSTWGTPTKKINSVAWSTDGKFIYTAGSDFHFRCWEVEKNRLVFDTPRGANPLQVTISRDGKLMLSPGDNGAILMYDAHRGGDYISKFSEETTLPQWGGMFSADGSLAVTTAGDNRALVWDVATGTIYQRFEGHHDKTQASVITSDGRRIVTGSLDRTVRLWGIRTR